jgi:transcriptional regulator GlxA family with amidase domain
MQLVGFVVTPGFQIMSLAALAAFEFANSSVEKPLYDVRVLSEAGGRVPSSLGLAVETKRFTSVTFDTVVVSGSMDIVPASRGVLGFLRKAAKRSRRVASICTGAFILAEAGLLDGRRVTTHWCAARVLQARYPKVRLNEDRIFIVDAPIWTSAGASAGVDLALGMIEEDLGAEVARIVAKKLVLSHRRAGGQSQYSVLLELDAKSDRIQSVLTYAKQNLRALVRRAAREGGAPQPAPVQPRIPGCDRSLSRQGHREPARGGRASDDHSGARLAGRGCPR